MYNPDDLYDPGPAPFNCIPCVNSDEVERERKIRDERERIVKLFKDRSKSSTINVPVIPIQYLERSTHKSSIHKSSIHDNVSLHKSSMHDSSSVVVGDRVGSAATIEVVNVPPPIQSIPPSVYVSTEGTSIVPATSNTAKSTTTNTNDTSDTMK